MPFTARTKRPLGVAALMAIFAFGLWLFWPSSNQVSLPSSRQFQPLRSAVTPPANRDQDGPLVQDRAPVEEEEEEEEDAKQVSFQLDIDHGEWADDVDIIGVNVCGTKRIKMPLENHPELTSMSFQKPAVPCTVSLVRTTLYGKRKAFYSLIPEEGKTYHFQAPDGAPFVESIYLDYLEEKAQRAAKKVEELDEKIAQADPKDRQMLLFWRMYYADELPDLDGGSVEQNWATISQALSETEEEVLNSAY